MPGGVASQMRDTVKLTDRTRHRGFLLVSGRMGELL